MTWDGDKRTLTFSSQEELQAFHDELSVLLRTAMVNATRLVEDPQKAKELSRTVMQDNAAVMRMLNTLRTSLERKAF